MYRRSEENPRADRNSIPTTEQSQCVACGFLTMQVLEFQHELEEGLGIETLRRCSYCGHLEQEWWSD